MAYSFTSPAMAGYQPIASLSTTEQVRGGFIAAVTDAVFGGGEVIYARANGSIANYALCVFTPVWDATNFRYTWNATECPNTANLGRTVGVAQGGAMTSGQYGWFLIAGTSPINGTASVAADTTFGITAAGQIGANTAGKQILNARVMTAATNTVAKTGLGASGSNMIEFPGTNNQGFFVGGYLSGTGVGVAAQVAYVDPLGAYILTTVVNSAAISGTVTQTANNATVYYNVATMNRPFAQGAIT